MTPYRNIDLTISTDILPNKAGFSGNTALEDHLPGELKIQDLRTLRDTERAIDHWRRNTWANDSIPFLETFDFSSMRNEWGHRFLICGGHAVENSVFVTYGIDFARLLGLPHKALTTTPFMQQIPKPYRQVFSEGYSKAMIESLPATLKGTFSYESKLEFYRAVFMPIMLQPNWSKQLILGSFNYRSADPAVRRDQT
jgi:hypothetical protein